MRLDIGQALKSPFQDKTWFKKFVLFHVIFVLSMVIPFVGIYLIGYFICNAHEKAKNPNAGLYGWNNTKNILGAGLYAFLFYILIQLLCIPAMFAGLASFTDPNGSILTTGICMVAILIILYYNAAAQISYIKDLKFSAFFNLSQINTIVSQNNGIDFIKYVLLMGVIVIVLSMLTGVTLGIGALITMPMLFYSLYDLTAQYANNTFDPEQ